MKNTIKILYISVLVMFAATACEQFKDISEIGDVESLSANISVTLNLGLAPTPDQLTVKMVNYAERYELTTTMAPDGSVTMNDVIPGVYTITITSEKSQGGFTYNYSGNVVNTDIVTNNKQINVEVGASKSGALVFKEVYYCGSRTPKNSSYFRDQFYEIYNNSEVVQNVRGLALALLNPQKATSNMPVYAEPDADEYVYALQMWQVPDDMDYPLNPGESIIIAQMADDHQKENLNPNAPVNLLSAEFETFVKTSSFVQDNPAINMTMAFWPRPSNQWLTTVFGGVFVIYFPSEPIDPNNTVSPVGSSTECIRIPIIDVVDALENIDDENKIQLKRLPAIIDAGAATVGGTYLAKSVARKVKETKENGRVVLFDTNNSTEDFEVMDPPVIRRYGAKAPSWNTWK